MLYRSLKFIFKAALKVFFREYKVNSKTKIPSEGPLIVVSNHPSTFMDPIIVASLLEQNVHFIAKGTLFNSVVRGWLMRNVMNSIPIHRKQDNSGDKKMNDAVFEQCFEFLESKGTMIIFPEGTSILERKLRPIKTGTARIALGAEARNDFNLGIRILCVGINYSNAPNFRSNVWINVEELIHLSDYQEKYQDNDKEAVRLLTNKIQEQLEKNIIVTQDEEEDQFVKDIESIYKNEIILDLKLDPQLHSFNLTNGIIDAINHFEVLDKNWLEGLKIKVSNYTKQLERYKLEDRFVSRGAKEDKNILRDSIMRLLFIGLGFSFYLYGLITNYLPYRISTLIAQKLTNSIEYVGPIKMTSGIFTFTMYYSLIIYLFQILIAQGDWWWTVYFAISLPIAGFFTLVYYHRFKNFRKHYKLISAFYKKPEEIGALLQERKSIVQDLDWAKDQYLRA